MKLEVEPETTRQVEELADRLRPGFNRRWTIARLDAMFSAGATPDPLPEGFLEGRLLTTSIWRPFDACMRFVAGIWMPWQGKAFDRSSSSGVNRFTPGARLPLKAMWPRYRPQLEARDRIEAFPFHTRVEPGAVDHELRVLKIDYDFQANPEFLIRRILDELVQVGEREYLGKVLFHVGSRFHPVGFFSLRKAD